MRHRADKLAVLQNGTAAHALDNTARAGAELGIGDGDDGVAAAAVAVEAADHDLVFLRLPAADRGQQHRRPRLELGGLHHPPAERGVQVPVNAVSGVLFHAAKHFGNDIPCFPYSDSITNADILLFYKILIVQCSS